MGKKQTEKQTGRKEPKRQKRLLTTARAMVLAAIIGVIGSIIVVKIDSNSGSGRTDNTDGPDVCNREPNIPIEPSPISEGLVVFNAGEWYEQVISGKKEIVCKPQTELNVDLRKVGIGMEDAIVERHLAYSKPQNNALEIEYEFTSNTEIGTHFLVHGFRKDPTNFVRLEEYEEGYILLRVKPMDIDDATNTDDYPAVSFGLKLRQGDTWFWDKAHHSSSNAKLHEQSGWRDIRLPIKPYLGQMRIVSSTVSEPLRLEQLLMIFGDTYASPRRSRFWLNAIVLVKKEMEPD